MSCLSLIGTLVLEYKKKEASHLKKLFSFWKLAIRMLGVFNLDNLEHQNIKSTFEAEKLLRLKCFPSAPRAAPRLKEGLQIVTGESALIIRSRVALIDFDERLSTALPITMHLPPPPTIYPSFCSCQLCVLDCDGFMLISRPWRVEGNVGYGEITGRIGYPVRIPNGTTKFCLIVLWTVESFLPLIAKPKCTL